MSYETNVKKSYKNFGAFNRCHYLCRPKIKCWQPIISKGCTASKIKVSDETLKF
jgi:hypothetical protein